LAVWVTLIVAFAIDLFLSCLAAAASEHVGNLLTAFGRYHTGRADSLQGLERRLDHVIGVGGSDRLRHHVLDPEGLEHSAHRTAGDDTGTGRRRAENHAARTEAAIHVVMQRAAFAERDTHHVALCRFRRLADGFGNLARLAVTVADTALLVTGNDECRGSEPASALHHLGHTVDVHQLIDELGIAF